MKLLRSSVIFALSNLLEWTDAYGGPNCKWESMPFA